MFCLFATCRVEEMTQIFQISQGWGTHPTLQHVVIVLAWVAHPCPSSLWGVAHSQELHQPLCHSVTLRLNERLILILVLPNIAATLASLLR